MKQCVLDNLESHILRGDKSRIATELETSRAYVTNTLNKFDSNNESKLSALESRIIERATEIALHNIETSKKISDNLKSCKNEKEIA